MIKENPDETITIMPPGDPLQHDQDTSSYSITYRQLYFKGRQHVLIKKTLLLKLMVVRCFLPISIFSKYEMMT